MKVRTNILIEESVLREAQELGLNVSKTCEILLKKYIEAIKQIQNQITQIPTSKAEKKSERVKGIENNGSAVAGGVGFEPTTTSLGGLRPILARLPAHQIFH